MGPWGAIIMGFFGSVFLALAARPYSITPGIYVLPIAVFVGIVIGAWRILRQQPAEATQPSARAERVITWASIGEGIAMPVVATVLGNTGHADAVLCGIALVVGLHFIPMAYAIPFPPFYALAGALLLAAVVGFALPQPLGSTLAGLGAAAALWLASGAALRRSRVA